jgi:UDP-N-acetylglucosamine:LPS N-acetylglucosamine transferase
MGGVQYSTYFLAEYLMKEKSAEVWIFLPGEGPFSVLCQENTIPYSIYNSIPYTSTSISLFNDEYRIPNPFALIYNMFAILLNSVRIKKKLNQQPPNLIITKGLLNHLSSGLACRGLNLPIIWHLQDLITNRYFGLMELICHEAIDHE